MKLPTLTRTPVSPPVSVDALVASTGGNVDEVLERYPAIGNDWMGRPMITFEHAKLFYDAAMQKQNADVMLPIRFDIYQSARLARRNAVAEAAAAAVTANWTLPRAGIEARERWRRACWAAVQQATAAFDEECPELTISAFRQLEKENVTS